MLHALTLVFDDTSAIHRHPRNGALDDDSPRPRTPLPQAGAQSGIRQARQKRNALSTLYAERHKDLRAFVERGPVAREPAPQLELFAGAFRQRASSRKKSRDTIHQFIVNISCSFARL